MPVVSWLIAYYPIFWHVYKNARRIATAPHIIDHPAQLFPDRAGGYRADLHHLYLVLWFVEILDNWFTPWIPLQYRPESYLPIELPGTELVLALIVLTIIGGLTANFLGRTLLSFSDRVIRQMPVIGSVYTALKQIFQTAMREDDQFSQVALIEYPRRGLHAIAFVTKTADIRVNEATGER